jgi:isoleucyl-tRNA synthetase
LLGNLAGYNAERDGTLPHAELMDIDRYVLHILHAFESTFFLLSAFFFGGCLFLRWDTESCKTSYTDYAYPKIVAEMLHLVHTDLSAFYFDMLKVAPRAL